MKRCTKCLLPDTFPHIEYNSQGVCNYCTAYNKIQLKPVQELQQLADRIRSQKGEQDCIVMFSGGRDSSYLLHYVIKELRLNPLVFTYDWGMSTPVGDENAQIMCDTLQVERIVIQADTKKKLKNIQLNVKAWLKKPNLGMIPIFMAGDKHYFLHVNSIAKKRNLNTVFIGTNPFEKTDFKTGFCGVKPNFEAKQIHSLTLNGKIKMLFYYLRQFITNSAYINRSLLDTFTAFFAFYGIKQEEVDLYKYLLWDEKLIDTILIEEYGWKKASDTPTTWRIGDGTAAFYNYIYHKVAGFTENDTLRSNQIREDLITREEAMQKVEIENLPRFDSIRWYLDRIGLDYKKTLEIIDSIPQLYK